MAVTALVLRALGLGDLLTAVPALRALHRTGRRVVLAAPQELRDVVTLTGAVDALLPAQGLDALRWDTRDQPDVAVNLHGRGPQSHRVLLATRPRRLWAYANDEFPDLPGPAWPDDEHEVIRWCRLVGWYGVRADPGDLALRVPAVPSPAPGAIVIHPGGKGTARRWPADRFAEVARALKEPGTPVVVTGSRGERPTALMVANQAGLPVRAVLAGRTSAAELAALVAGARLVVSSDTGIAHLATAYGTPSVVVFGPVSPAHWGPPPNRPQHRVLHRGPDPASVSAGDVLSAACDLLGSRV